MHITRSARKTRQSKPTHHLRTMRTLKLIPNNPKGRSRPSIKSWRTSLAQANRVATGKDPMRIRHGKMEATQQKRQVTCAVEGNGGVLAHSPVVRSISMELHGNGWKEKGIARVAKEKAEKTKKKTTKPKTNVAKLPTVSKKNNKKNKPKPDQSIFD